MAEQMTPEALTAYLNLAEKVRERFGDNWQIVDDADLDEVSVRTEDSSLGFYTEMFTTSQVHGDDPLEVAGFLAAAIDNVPRMAAAIRKAETERDHLAEQVKHASDLDLIRLAISDPGAFVKRERFNDGDYETVPAWGARAVVAALREGRGAR